MHQLKTLAFGPENFISTLIELRVYLKFNLYNVNGDFDKDTISTYDVLLFHEESLKNNQYTNIINNLNIIKILASNKVNKDSNFDGILKLPTTLNDINSIINKSAIKKVFSKNSSIDIKGYLMDKNQKKLKNFNQFVDLTEKEIQLLELFLIEKKPISKSKILSLVWHYSSDADTHTVETHIYRLRKKISKTFSDEKFILNNRDGYYL
tara:strand:- start:3111 stop:3734 length:624 start_codon:yes stop_codon:yes gene_type:complete